jgi:hypothetical protein
LTAAQHGLTIRPITGPGELGLFCRLPYVLNEELADDLESGRRKAGWMWVALHGGHLVARAAWWTGHAGAGPEVLDVFDIAEHPEGVGIGARLLRDVPRIRASTDLGNGPMAEAFRRAGWVNFGRTVNMTWS